MSLYRQHCPQGSCRVHEDVHRPGIGGAIYRVGRQGTGQQPGYRKLHLARYPVRLFFLPLRTLHNTYILLCIESPLLLISAAKLTTRAKDYASVTQTCLDNKLCPGITLWGFGDETSWVPGVFAGQGAATIKDFDYKPKSAYYSIQSTLKK